MVGGRFALFRLSADPEGPTLTDKTQSGPATKTDGFTDCRTRGSHAFRRTVTGAVVTISDMNVVTNAEHGSELLTVAEVAQRLRCSEPTVRRRVRDGQIPAVKLGHGRSVIRINAAELNNWLYQQEKNE